jgi:phage shock protein PspC (stress-responsive transcriptional regulator)
MSNVPSPPAHPVNPLRRASLRRSRDSKVIFGVCGGFGEYFGIDAVILRVGLVVLGLLTGGAIIPLYFLSIFILPKQPRRERAAVSSTGGSNIDGGVFADEVGPAHAPQVSHSSLGAAVLIGLGLLALMGKVGVNVDGGLLWPLAFIGFGVAVLWSRRKPPDPGPVTPATSATNSFTEAMFEEPPHAFSSLVDSPIVQRAYDRESVAKTVTKSRPAAKDHSLYARFSRGAVFAVLGVIWLSRRLLPFDVSVRSAVALALLIIGLFTMAGAWLGRPKLLTLGVALALFLGITSTADIRFEGPFGDQTFALTNAAAFGSHHLEAGTMTLDAHGVPRELLDRSVVADVSMGEINVIVPSNVDVEIASQVGLGAITIDGKSIDLVSKKYNGKLKSQGPSAGTLKLDLKVRVGEIVIERAGKVATSTNSPTNSPTNSQSSSRSR